MADHHDHPDTTADRLRSTSQEMAVSCSVPMDLWDRHSHVALAAADRINVLEAALVSIRECMGGDTPGAGWDAPEDVWGIATEALNGRE